MSSAVDVPKTYGALLLGALFASVLSGTVSLQTLLYFKLYPLDYTKIKALVTIIWLLDTSHTSFIWAAIWDYMIEHNENAAGIDRIPWSLSLTIVLTAILTFFVHLFFAHRIFLLSRKNWLLTIPIVVLAVLRLASASVTTAEMMRLASFTAFRAQFRWVFTLGLALSSSVDFLITGSLFLLLQNSRTGAERLNAIIDSLILYTFETGSLTCAATIVSMICWLAIPSNLIFMGLHFVIGKLYANSLLVTLNTRFKLRRGASETYMYANERLDPVGSILVLDTRRYGDEPKQPEHLQVSVERSIQYTVESRQFHSNSDAYVRTFASDKAIHSGQRDSAEATNGG